VAIFNVTALNYNNHDLIPLLYYFSYAEITRLPEYDVKELALIAMKSIRTMLRHYITNQGFKMKYPIRHSNHSLEEKSITFFRQCLPEDWNINPIARDYGQDLNIEIIENGMYQGLELVIQLKSSKAANTVADSESQTFKVSTYNYLWGNLRVVMIVKFIELENEAYWTLLKDVQSPNQDNETFTINLPRQNKLSTLDWNIIAGYVKNVTDIKLAAMRVRGKEV
jgi:hypothetical protein